MNNQKFIFIRYIVFLIYDGVFHKVVHRTNISLDCWFFLPSYIFCLNRSSYVSFYPPLVFRHLNWIWTMFGFMEMFSFWFGIKSIFWVFIILLSYSLMFLQVLLLLFIDKSLLCLLMNFIDAFLPRLFLNFIKESLLDLWSKLLWFFIKTHWLPKCWLLRF